MQIQNGSGPHAGNALPVRGFNQQRANLFAQHAAALVNSINDQRQQLDTVGGRVQEITANVQAVANANTRDDRNLVVAEGAVQNLNADAARLRLDVDRNRRDSSVLDTAAQLLVELQDANMEFDRSADGSLKILINLGASAGGIVYAIYISPMIPVTGSALLNGSIRALMAVARKGQASTTKEFFSEFITGFLSCLAVAGVTKHISLPMIKFLGLKHQYSRELAGKILSDAVVNVVEKKCTGKEILIKDIALRALGSLAGDLAAEGLPLLIGEPRDSLERVLMAAGSGAVRSAVNHLVTNLCDNKKSWKDSLFESAVFEAILSAVMEARQIHYENHQRVVEPHIKPEVKPDSKEGDQGEVNKPDKPDNKDKGEKPVKKDKKEKGGKPVKKDKKEKGGKPVKKDKKEKGEKPTKKDDKDNADKPGKKDDNNDPGDVNGATGGSLPPLNKPNIEGAVDVLTKEGYVDTNKPVLADNRNTIDRLKNGEEIKLVKPDGSFVKLKLVDGKLQVIVRGNYGILKKVEDAANALPNVPSPSPDAPAPSNQNANDGHAVAKSATTHNPEDKNRLQAQTPLNQVAPPPQPQAPVNEVSPPPQPQAPVNQVAPAPQPQAPVNDVAPPPQPQAPVNQVAPAPQPQEVQQNDEDDSDEEGAQVVPQQPLLNIVQQPVFNPQLNGVNQPVLPVVMANFGVNQVKAARHLQRLERQLKSLPTGKRGRARRAALSMQIQELQRNRT